jgi:hypothetical protein
MLNLLGGYIGCETISSMGCITAISSICTACKTGSYLNNAIPHDVYTYCPGCPIYCSSCASVTYCTACTTSTSHIFVNISGKILCATIS